LIISLPMIFVLVLIIRCTSKGPGIFKQLRVGLHGQTFMIYKLRTMRNDAERETGPVWTQHGDNRVTPLGRIMRKLHLDEFPQLFNVLKGEMTLVGPRPERPEFVQRLALRIPGYMKRLDVPPGITGLAQLNLPPDSDLNSVRRKQALDLEYAAHANLWLDLRLLVATFLRLPKISEKWVLKILGLHRTVILPQEGNAPISGEKPATFGDFAFPHVTAREKENGKTVLEDDEDASDLPLKAHPHAKSKKMRIR
jgi:lipopolysaccharide/colanic/teichoic acid biosynthesis glycosyltransferase